MKRYACNNEYDGAVIGTLSEIFEYIRENDWNLGDCTFYELGKEVVVELKAVEK